MPGPRPGWKRGDQAKMDSKVPQIATKTIDSNVTRNAAKTLIRPQTRGWMCHGLLPVRRLYAFERTNASIPNTRPKVRYQPVLGMIRPVTRTP